MLNIRTSALPGALYDTALKKRRVAGFAVIAVLLTLFVIFNRVPKPRHRPSRPRRRRVADRRVLSGVLHRARTRIFPFLPLVGVLANLSAPRRRRHDIRLPRGGRDRIVHLPKMERAGAFGRRRIRLAQRADSGPRHESVFGVHRPGGVRVSQARGRAWRRRWRLCRGLRPLNLPSLIMVAMVFVPMIGGTRVALSVVGALLLGPLVAKIARGGEPREPADGLAISPAAIPRPGARRAMGRDAA